VGPLTATALVAAVGNAQRFRNGRELSAYLGLVPRQHSSGGKTVLLGITKRGDRYLRTLLIHGARSALRQCKLKGDARSDWARRISAERGPNVAAVALANKNARVLWESAREILEQAPGAPWIARRIGLVHCTADRSVQSFRQRMPLYSAHSYLRSHLVIRINRVFEIMTLEAREPGLRYHPACHRFREPERSQASASRFRQSRGHAAHDREAVHQSSQRVVRKVFLKRGLAMDVRNQPGPIAFQRLANSTDDYLRMRHVMNAIEGGDEVKARIRRQGITPSVVEGNVVHASLGFICLGPG